jgi:hypothetical protein
VSTRAEPVRELEREWWLRTLLVLRRPREVFMELRDDSVEAATARQEPLTAVIFLAGISIFLSTRTAAHLFDDVAFDALLVVVEAVVAGMLVGLQNFWLLGGAVHLGARAADAETSYRQARHIVGLAGMPFVLALVAVWPVRLALYGSDVFRTGGADAGTGDHVFQGIDAAFLAWSVALIVIGVRTVHGWTWARSLAAFSLAGVFMTLGVAAVFVL